MPIEYQKLILRSHVRANRDKLYVFGDNVRRTGYGGQAGAMRGEPNTVGVATKWFPSLDTSAYFSDEKFTECVQIIYKDVEPIIDALREDNIVVWPKDGIGTGLSDLPNCAPKIWKELQHIETILLRVSSTNPHGMVMGSLEVPYAR